LKKRKLPEHESLDSESNFGSSCTALRNMRWLGMLVASVTIMIVRDCNYGKIAQ